MAPCVESGHYIRVPPLSADLTQSRVHIEFAQHKAHYYMFSVDNITTGEKVPFFIAAEYYMGGNETNPHHITNVAEPIDGEGYKMKVDSKLQYAQRDGGGVLFVVYHDQEQKHRFGEAMSGGYGAHELVQAFVGDYIHTFQ